jgi:PEP-CTERM motif
LRRVLLRSIASAAALGLVNLVSSANATVIFGGVANPSDLNLTATATNFNGADATTASLNSLSGYTQIGSPLTFKGTNASLEQILDTTSGIGALPYLDTTKYLSVLGNGLVTVTLSAAATQVSFYWGSIDKYNTITFSDGQSFTGNDIAGKTPDGCQQMIDCNGVVTFKETNGGTFTSFTMSSGQNSFETDNFDVVLAPPVPEPSTWAMMILGFLGVGFMAYRRKVSTPAFRLV